MEVNREYIAVETRWPPCNRGERKVDSLTATQDWSHHESGVIGLLCAALGRPRHEPLDDFRQLAMAVRVDREGELRRDFQTAGGGQLSIRQPERSAIRSPAIPGTTNLEM